MRSENTSPKKENKETSRKHKKQDKTKITYITKYQNKKKTRNT